MAENSAIELTDHTWSEEALPSPRLPQVSCAVRLEVLKLVAVLAERDTVLDIEPKVWKVGVGADVVGAKIAPLSISASLADETVASENRQPPVLVLRLAAVTLLALPRTVLPRIVLRAALPVLPNRGRDPCLGFRRQRHTATGKVRLSGAQRAHRRPCLGRMRSSLEGAHTTLCRAGLIHPRAIKALRLSLIPARAVSPEMIGGLPLSAGCAPLQANGNPLQILFNWQAAPARRCLDTAFGSASHE